MGGDRCQLSSQGRNWTPDLVTRDYLLFGNNGQNPWAHSFLSGITHRTFELRSDIHLQSVHTSIGTFNRPMTQGGELLGSQFRSILGHCSQEVKIK